MAEHTITVMRQMLTASQSDDVITGLKEQQKHKFRSLIEARIPFMTAGPSQREQAVRAAAREAGITDAAAIRALTNELVANPGAILKGNFWSKIGRGLASAVTHGKFDPSYRVPAQGSTLSSRASSLERVGGPVATGAYKAGRALQRAEKWLTPWDIESGEGNLGVPGRRYSRDSAFDPAGARHRRDQCAAKAVRIPGEKPAFIGHKMGTPEYEQCMSGDEEAARMGELKRVLSRQSTAKKLPAFVAALGLDPELYMKRQRADLEVRGRSWARAAQTFRGR